MARKTSADTFRQNIKAVVNRESDFYRGLFGAGDRLPAIKMDRGNCESFRSPMIEYETTPVISNCYWEQSDEQVFEGDFSFRLRKRSGVGLRASVLLTEDTGGLHGLVAGNTYRFSCYMRVPEENVRQVFLSVEDSERSSSSAPDSGFIGDWQRVFVTHTIHEDATFAMIGVETTQEMPANVDVYFDNFELVSESSIISSDFDGGSIYDEIELARAYVRYFTESINVKRAQEDILTDAANRYLHLQRGLIVDENDEDYINRFDSLVVAKLNPRRTTRQAIIDALSYFIEPIRIEIVERFDIENNKFRIKFLTFQQEFDSLDANLIAITDQAYFNNSYLSGLLGSERPPVNPNILDTLLRVKAAGVLVDSQNVDRRRITIQSGIAYDFAVVANQSPVARAGSDVSVAAGASVTLDGSSSTDPDGTIDVYLWEQLSGDTVSLSGSNTSMATFTTPSNNLSQSMTFRLTVTDNSGSTSTDTTIVQVAAALRLPAQANLAFDYQDTINVTLPEALGGFGNLVYVVSGLPSGAAFDTATRQLSGTALVVGDTEVTYRVTDGANATAEITFDISTAAIQSAAARNFVGVAGYRPQYSQLGCANTFRRCTYYQIQTGIFNG